MKPRLLFAILLCSVTVSVLAANSLATIRARGQLIVSVKNVGDKAVEKHRDPAHFQKRGMELAIAQIGNRKYPTKPRAGFWIPRACFARSISGRKRRHGP